MNYEEEHKLWKQKLLNKSVDFDTLLNTDIIFLYKDLLILFFSKYEHELIMDY